MKQIFKFAVYLLLSATVATQPLAAAERVDEALLEELTGMVPNPDRKLEDLGALYVQMFESLTRRLSSKTELDRTQSQASLEAMVIHVGKPGNEAQAKVFCSAIAKQLENKDYPIAGRHILIRGLGSVGSSDCVPTLVGVIGAGDPIESDLARMSLQQIPGDDAHQALIGLIKAPAAEPNAILGLIDSLSGRGEDSMVTAVAPFLDNPIPEFAEAADTALGRVGGGASRNA